MTSFSVYFGLFGIAFLAATILPAQSELGLSALLLTSEHSIVMLILVASLGNTLGAVVNWRLGREVERFKNRKWFPASEAQLDKACRWYQKYGQWSLLMSWVPIIGDPLTLAAGVLREPLKPFLILVAIAKTTRYIVVALLVLGIFEI